MRYRVVIPAAGQGKRMGAGMNKQFIELDGEPLLIHTVRFFEKDEACTGIVLVANESECHLIEELASHYKLTKVIAVIKGGKERQNSVYNGLKHVEDDQIVLIHDGARPFVTTDMVRNLVAIAAEKGAATAAVRVKDTIKRAENGKVVNTLNRDALWAVQTPQAFKVSLLIEAHDKAKEAGFLTTDDASLVEWLGRDVYITEGDDQNIKLTTPVDLLVAETIMRERKNNDD